MKLGDKFPNFECVTNQGKLRIHDYFGDSWGVLLSHPKDFTPVCTTEVVEITKLQEEFRLRNVKVIALSVDTSADHDDWVVDVESLAEYKVEFPLISDENRQIAITLGMLDPSEKDENGLRLAARAVFVVGPDKKLKLSILYPVTTGRNYKELLRVVDSLQLAAKTKLNTPANWNCGEECLLSPGVSDKEARGMFNNIRTVPLPSGKNYMRFVKPNNIM